MRDVLPQVRSRVDACVPEFRRWLEELIRIPSVSAPGFDPTYVRRSAEYTATILNHAGLRNVRLLELDGVHPYVAAEWLEAGSAAPTVLLYAHHDVQPPGRIDRWTSDPFDPVERGGRLFGRGSADDKAGIVMHAAAISGWLHATGGLPCNVKVLIEGEEEIGSGHLRAFLDRYGSELRADVIVLADAGNWSVGQPALTYALRGITELTVRVRALQAPQHSGVFGGLLPDPVQALAKMLATLLDNDGRPAVPSLSDDVQPLSAAERARLARLRFDADQYARVAGLVAGGRSIGDPDKTAWERLWMQPSIAVIGLDAHPIHGSSNQILADAAARISVRLAPGQDPQRCQHVLAEHLRRVAPWGVQVEIDLGHDSSPAWVCDPSGPAFEAAEDGTVVSIRGAAGVHGRRRLDTLRRSIRGSVRRCASFLTGPADPTSRIHSEDESLHLDDCRRHCHAEARLLAELAARL